MSITTNFESDFLHILGRIKSFLNERYKIGLVTWLCVDCVEKEGIKTWGGEGIGFFLFLALFKKKIPTPTVASLFQENSYGKQKILIINHNK